MDDFISLNSNLEKTLEKLLHNDWAEKHTKEMSMDQISALKKHIVDYLKCFKKDSGFRIENCRRFHIFLNLCTLNPYFPVEGIIIELFLKK